MSGAKECLSTDKRRHILGINTMNYGIKGAAITLIVLFYYLF
jgi:hypothetical protein